jgi:5'-deoxynucleotidase
MMALVHDMAESIVGDITPLDGVSKGPHLASQTLMVEEKHRLEVQAMGHLVSLLPGPMSPNANTLDALFNEYEEGLTPEAIIIKDVDKYELLVQALEYERDVFDHGDELTGLKDLSNFFNVRHGLKTETVKAWAEDLMRERTRMWEQKKEGM